MEYDSSPAKRRKTSPSHVNQESNLDSNKDSVLLSPTDATNTQVLVNKNDSITDHFDIEKESKNGILIEGSTMVAIEEIGGNQYGDDGHYQSRKKLLVLDVNGLLVDIVADPVEAYAPDTIIASKAVFKRPYCDEFLKFCFERFSVGVWTSRTRKNIARVLDFLMKDSQHQLLFCWDQSHCTETGFNTIENSGKPLLLKELKKLWEKQDPSLPWDRGTYDESNTILLDDSPYKALRNPPYTAIFPYTYIYRDTQDNGLGPNGDLRKYLERLAASDNIQKFIEQNPFGQQPISHDNESWNFYHKIIFSTPPGAGPSRSRRKLIVIDMGGLLIDVASVPREGFRADTMHGSRSVFKRPYCDEFLQFCFQRFNVGVWTTTIRRNMECDLDFLMRDAQHKLLFCWDIASCTDTGFRTVENSDKMLVLKELRKLWEKKEPNLPWEIGEYDESNTLLVDNASHRALLNPPHTAIFPYPYRHWHTEDNSLGPEGDLRIYLERLAESDNVQKFVSENSFGQRPIREKNLSWGYYQKIIHAFSYKRKARDLLDAQCKNSSEPNPDITVASVTKTLSEPKIKPKPDITIASVTKILSGPKTNSSTALAAPTLLEPKPNSTTTSATHTLVEPETISTTILTAPTLLEPRISTTTALVGQNLESELGGTALTCQPSLEPETTTSTIFTAHTFVEPQTSTTTALVAQPLSEPDLDSTTQAAKASLGSETVTTAILAAPTLFEPETSTTIALVGQTLPETEINTSTPAAQTSLESETFTSDDAHSGFTTSLKGAVTADVDNVTVGAALSTKTKSPSLNRSESKSAVNSSVTCSTGNTKLTVSVTGTSGPDDIQQDSPPVEHDIIVTQTSGPEDGKSNQKSKRGKPPKSVGLKQTGETEDGKSNQKRKRGRPPKLVGSKETGEVEGGKTNQKRKTERPRKLVDLKQTSEVDGGKSNQKRKAERPPKLVDVKKRSGADDGKSYQKRTRGRPPKLVVEKPTDLLDDTHGITTDLDKQPLSVLYEGILSLSVIKRNSCLSPPDHHDKSLNQAIVTTECDVSCLHQDTNFNGLKEQAEDSKSHLKRKRKKAPKSKQTSEAEDGKSHPKRKRGRPSKLVATNPIALVEGTTDGTTTDYQQDWPFIKQCPIWATIEPLVLCQTPPQKPHFSPLKNTNELYRESLAIAQMVTYWNLVQRLSRLKPDDPVDIIHNSLEVLVELETHGFDVDAIRGRLNELLYSKSKASQREDTLKELEKCNHEKLVMEKETDRLKVEMQKLQEKMVQAETMQKVKEEEITRLESKLASNFQANQ